MGFGGLEGSSATFVQDLMGVSGVEPGQRVYCFERQLTCFMPMPDFVASPLREIGARDIFRGHNQSISFFHSFSPCSGGLPQIRIKLGI